MGAEWNSGAAQIPLSVALPLAQPERLHQQGHSTQCHEYRAKCLSAESPSHIYACVHTDINTICNFSHEIGLTGSFGGFLGKQESRLPSLSFHFSFFK